MVISPRVGRSRSSVTSSKECDEDGGCDRGEPSTAENRDVQREQAHDDGGADHLEPEDSGGDAIVQPGDPHGLLVDHLVEGLDVETWRGRGWGAGDGLPREAPEATLELGLLGRGPLRRVAARNLVRHSDREVGVAPEQVQRLGALRFGKHLGAEVCRADGVGIVDNRDASILVAADGEAQAEGEDQPYDPEESTLEDADRFAKRVRVPAQVAAGGRAREACAADEGEDDEPDGPARKREEHGITTLNGRPTP